MCFSFPYPVVAVHHLDEKSEYRPGTITVDVEARYFLFCTRQRPHRCCLPAPLPVQAQQPTFPKSALIKVHPMSRFLRVFFCTPKSFANVLFLGYYVTTSGRSSSSNSNTTCTTRRNEGMAPTTMTTILGVGRRQSVPRESELIRSFQSQPKPAREHFFKCDETTRSHGIECARYV